MKAIRRNLRISSKKVNLVASLVRGMPVENAINTLSFAPKSAARPMMELIKSAAANAVANFKQKRETLFVQQIIVNEGATFKRWNPVSRGRSHPILKRTSHITVELGVQAVEKEDGKTEKQETGSGAEKAESKKSAAATKASPHTRGAEPATAKAGQAKKSPKKSAI
ncbi:50S ribosomal protein L22 [Candidatus Peregrinibacteria bacterium CG11_big_fil_rev_8_21_14_0_20_46_8]|nr:MAG: 50S ribosomal protein L22 [Candidatus Peregrinibacteria bacterium CG11_big_fil_rev_8_21_14_0_20_46_8]